METSREGEAPKSTDKVLMKRTNSSLLSAEGCYDLKTKSLTSFEFPLLPSFAVALVHGRLYFGGGSLMVDSERIECHGAFYVGDC